MPPKRRGGSSMLPNRECTLGWMFVEERLKCEKAFEEKLEDGYVWIQEVLIEIKRSLITPEVELCPKTPSKKKRRGRQRKAEENESEPRTKRKGKGKRSSEKGKDRGVSQDMESSLMSTDSQEDADSAESTRSTRARTRANKTTASTGRSTRSRKAKDEEAKPELNGPEPIFSMNEERKPSASKEDSKTVSFKSVNGAVSSEEERVSSAQSGSEADVEDASPEKNPSRSVIVIDTESSGNEVSPSKKLRKTPPSQSHTPSAGNVKSPISAIKTVIRSRTPVAKVARNSPSSQSPRTRGQALLEDSPRRNKTIPNFSILSVKEKANAYEEHVNKVQYDSCGTSDDSHTPKRSSTKILSAKGEAGARRQDKQSEQNSKERRSVRKSGVHRRTSRRSSRVSGVRTSLRMSLSKKRSSIMRYKMRTSQIMSKQVKQEVNESLKLSPKKSPPAKSVADMRPQPIAVTKPRKGYHGKGDGGIRLGAVRTFDTNPLAKVRPRSKPRLCEIANDINSSPIKASPAKLNTNKPDIPTAQGILMAQASFQQPGATRSTRSKLRLNKAPPTLPAESSSEDAADDKPKQPVRSTRSKMRLNQPQPPRLPDAEDMDTQESTSPDEVDGLATPRANRHHATLPTPPSSNETVKKQPTACHEEMQGNPDECINGRVSTAGKRSQPMSTEESDEQTPPKRRLVDSEGDEEFVEGTPQRKSGPRIVKPLRGGTTDSAQKRYGNCVAKSFLQRNMTPQKKSVKEQEEERRKNLEAKAKDSEKRLAKRDKLQQMRRLELRKQREERHKRVAGRREQQEKKEQEAKIGLVHKLEVQKNPRKLIEEKLNEVKEKREKKIAEAEQRRRQEEEMRLQKLREQEEEKRRQEEQLAKKKEQEERERARKVAEQRRLEEERRIEQERERQRDAARKKALEEEMRRRQEAERREREERERRERAERERIELQRQQERERLKREEIEKMKELELKRLRENRAKEQERLREEREVANMIKKHNHALQQNTSHNTSLQQSSLATKPKLNSSYTVSKPVGGQHSKHAESNSQDSDSYEMTPVRKKVTKSNSEENYGIEDIKSDDSTDEEDQPRKKIPNWALGAQLKASLIHQYYQPPDLDSIFDTVMPPNLNEMFIKKRPRFNRRGSSGVWDSPILKPSGGLPT